MSKTQVVKHPHPARSYHRHAALPVELLARMPELQRIAPSWALGVFLNPLIHYPWSGQMLDLLGKHVELSRQWSAVQGVIFYERIGGLIYESGREMSLSNLCEEKI